MSLMQQPAIFTCTTHSIARYAMCRAMVMWVAGCHTPVLCLNGYTYLKTLSTFW